MKTISILFLVVLVALAGGSPVFAQDEAFITLTPAAACPGASVSISGNILVSDFNDNFDGRISAVVSSVPDGLVGEYECVTLDTSVECTFLVSESASCGRYTVTVTLEIRGETPLVIGSASHTFDVAGTCCAAVGGCVQPVNTFALLSPWLALIGLVGCTATVVVAVRKTRE